MKNLPEPRTDNQKLAFKSMQENVMTVISGPAGTGKTLLACSFIANQLYMKLIERVIILRPFVNIGRKDLGAFPGSLAKKSQAWMGPVIDHFKRLGISNHGKIEYSAISMFRGASIESGIIFVDEAQNLSMDEASCLIGRVGENSKLIISGDESQSDIDNSKAFNLLIKMAQMETEKNYWKHVAMEEYDILRSDFCKVATNAWNKIKDK